MSPKSVDKEAKKRQILEAAIAVFARKGVGNTRIAEIAAEAGTGKGTIYEYFRSKEQLFQEAFGHFLQQVRNLLKTSLRLLRQEVILFNRVGHF